MVSQVAEMPSVNEVILHCQKQIKKEPAEDKLLHYLGRLTRLRITTQDLVETGIGRTVNQLSRHDGDVGSAARKLVRQWKAMVAEESKVSGSDSNSGSSSNEDDEEEDEEEDAEGDENGATQFVEKEVNNRHSDEDASSHNDQQSVSEAMEEDDDQDSDVSDRLCIDDEVPTQPLRVEPQPNDKILPSSSSESDSDSDGMEDPKEWKWKKDANHRKGSSSESEHQEMPSEYVHIKQEPIINSRSYDGNDSHGNNHLEHPIKYEPKSSASSSRHSEDEFSDSSSHSPKRKANAVYPKTIGIENDNTIQKSRSPPNDRESEKKYDSSEDEKYKKKSSDSKTYDKYSKVKSSSSKSGGKDKDSSYSKEVLVKKEPLEQDEEYEPEKPKYGSSREKDNRSNENDKSKHRERDGEKSKRHDRDRDSEKSRNGSRESEKSKHQNKDKERDRDRDGDRSKRHEKSDKSKYNDREKSKHGSSSQHKERDRDRDRDLGRLESKEKDSRSSESKNQTVKLKLEPGYESYEKERSQSRDGKKSSESKSSSKSKSESGSQDSYSDRERSNHRENKSYESKNGGTNVKIKAEPFSYDNYYNDRSSSHKSSSGYNTVNSKSESGYESYPASAETDPNVKVKPKADSKEEKSYSSRRDRERDRDRDEKNKDRKESKESQESKDKDRGKERHRDKEKDKDNRKRKHNGELSDKEEQSSSKKARDSSESNKSKPEVEKSKAKKPKLVICREIDSTSGINFADVLNCLDTSSTKSSSKKKDSKEKSFKKSVIVPPTSSKKDEVVSLVRKSDIDKLAAEKKKNRNKNGIIESIIAPTVNISPNYKPATNIAVLPKLPKPISSVPAMSLASLGLNDPSNWEDSRATEYEDNSRGDALSTMMSSRNARTKVFSGNKAALKGEVPKLFDLCMHVIQENIQDLGYTGGVPFDILKPALERATATQLYNIEDCNPYLIEDTDELWKFHCSRDFRGRLPQELESWRELYLRCVDEREARFQSLTVKMKRKVEVAEPVRKTKLAYVETHFGGPRFSKSKAATIKNGMKSLKFREEKGVKRAHGMSAGSGGSGAGSKGSTGIIEEAAVIISSDSRAGSAPAPSVSREPSVAKMKPKKAPLMQKTMKLIKTLCRR